MPDFQQLIESGSAHVWLYIPVAIFLGALHGLEPGHSKTMMAAFIIAIRGTVWQAVLLGISAAISHSVIIWLLAGLALYYGNQFNAESTEPILQLISAALILGLAIWMFLRTRREVHEAHAHQHGHDHDHGSHSHDHDHDHHHHHHEHDHSHGHHAPREDEPKGLIVPGFIQPSRTALLILPPGYAPSDAAQPNRGLHGGIMVDTGHGWLEACIATVGDGSIFRIYPCRANGELTSLPNGNIVTVAISRIDGREEQFTLKPKTECWEAQSPVAAPHDFVAVVSLGHSGHFHTYRLRFSAGDRPGEQIKEEPILPDDPSEYQDAHEREHAEEIARRFSNRNVTTWQIILFGITGGLMPCPAAFTILLVCLQIDRIPLGFALVASFSIGLALTMVTVGAVAAWGVHHAQKRVKGFSEWMRKAPYISCALLIILAAFMAWQGLNPANPHQH